MGATSPAEKYEKRIVGSIAGAMRPAAKAPLAGRGMEKEAVTAEDGSSVKKAPGAFRTIGEVAEDLNVQQHVLRFWETKFSQIRPLKRGGGRRYYRPEDLLLLKRIHHLLYTEGYTIKGVQKLLREKGRNGILQKDENAPAAVSSPSPATNANAQPQSAKAASVQVSVQGMIGAKMSGDQKELLQAMLGELKEIRSLIKPE